MYFASTAVVVCEVLKLLVSVLMALKESPGMGVLGVFRKKVFNDPLDTLRLMVNAYTWAGRTLCSDSLRLGPLTPSLPPNPTRSQRGCTRCKTT